MRYERWRAQALQVTKCRGVPHQMLFAEGLSDEGEEALHFCRAFAAKTLTRINLNGPRRRRHSKLSNSLDDTCASCNAG